MAWSYSGNPGANTKDAVRFLIGDTDASDPQLHDGEITWLLSQYNNAPINAAVRACETLTAKYSRLVDEAVGQVRLSYSQRSKAFRELRADLVRRLALSDAVPYAGGISVSDIQANDSNADRVKPSFTRHMMENSQISPWVTKGLEDFLNDPT